MIESSGSEAYIAQLHLNDLLQQARICGFTEPAGSVYGSSERNLADTGTQARPSTCYLPAAPGPDVPAAGADCASPTMASSSTWILAGSKGTQCETAEVQSAAAAAGRGEGLDGYQVFEQSASDVKPAASAADAAGDVECVVCWEAEAGVVFQPCGHL